MDVDSADIGTSVDHYRGQFGIKKPRSENHLKILQKIWNDEDKNL